MYLDYDPLNNIVTVKSKVLKNFLKAIKKTVVKDGNNLWNRIEL